MIPEFQYKPVKKPNYKERVRLGLQRGGLKKKSEKQKIKDSAELKQHNKNIKNNSVYCVKCGNIKHIEKHHYKGRKYPSEFIYLCGEFGCGMHSWIHKNENKALELGWLWPEYRGLNSNENQPKPWSDENNT